MFFPTSPQLPTVGDTVCIRHHHTPYTVGMVTPDRTLYHLVGLDEPARVETLAWYPQPGDRVEVLMCPYIQYLSGKFDQHNQRWWAAVPGDKPAIEQTLNAIKAAMKRANNYRMGELLRVEGALAQVRFGNEPEVLPFECLSVVERIQNVAENRTDIAA